MQDESLAVAMVLAHGLPPKSLIWKVGGFEKRSVKAKNYCRDLEELCRVSMPGIRMGRVAVRRNRVLRCIMASVGEKQRP